MGKLSWDYIRKLDDKERRAYKNPAFDFDYRNSQIDKFREETIQIFGQDPYIYIKFPDPPGEMPIEVYLADYLGLFLRLQNAALFLMDPNREFSIKASLCLPQELVRNIRFTCDSAIVLWLLRFGPLVKPKIGQKSYFSISPDLKTTEDGISLSMEFQSPNEPIIPDAEIDLTHKEMDLLNAKAMVPLVAGQCLLGFLSLGESFMVPPVPPDDPDEEFSQEELLYLGLYAFKLTRILMWG